MNISDRTIDTLAASLNMRQLRQKLITSNIANAETPGYKAKRLDFEEALARAIDIDKMQSLNTDNDKHYNVGGGGFKNLKPEVYEDANGVVKDDGNTVDRDYEMAMMADNQILYNATVQLLKKKLGLMNYAISAEK